MLIDFSFLQGFFLYSSFLVNLFFLAPYNNIFEFGIRVLPENSFIRFLISLNWLFGFAFFPSLSLFAFFYYKNLFRKLYGLFLCVLSLDLITNSLLDIGGLFGHCVSFFLPVFWSVLCSIFGFVLSNFLIFDLQNNFRIFKGKKSRRSPHAKIRVKDEEVVNFSATSSLPSVDLLLSVKKSQVSIDIPEQKTSLLRILKDFGISAKIIESQIGPVVTLYSLELAPGIKSSRVINLSDDIARSMQALSARIANIPGTNLVGVEIANPSRQIVSFKDGLLDPVYKNFDGYLPIVLGANIAGEQQIADLSKMPHLLVAGTTGSGKSVAIHSMILSLLFKLNPSECKFILIDPKMLELKPYTDIPHLLLPVVTEPKKAIRALKWAVKEMEDRYKKMATLGVRNISTYNAKIAQEANNSDNEDKVPFMPFIVIVIDEMADLMLVAGKEIEFCVQRLAQMARAAGIHLIMATQRPSVDVITGTIKANFPTRISFKLASKIDSRTILGDIGGAEQLLGQGDMLYLSNTGTLKRIHGGFVSEEDVQHVVDFWKEQGSPQYIDLPDEEERDDLSFDDTSDVDPYYYEALELIRSTKKVSTSFLQRNFPIGYNRAAKIIEKMEKNGVVTCGDKFGRNREIL